MGLSTFQATVRRDLEEFRHAFTSKEAFVKYIETKPDAAKSTGAIRNQWTNEDLDISPPSHRTWGWYDYAAFWFSYGFSPGLWYLGAALLANGLTPGQALGCLFLGFFFGSVGIVMHSRAAATYHFGFPVESRLVWGLWGSYFPVVIRALCALIWGGVTIATGGYFTSVLLRCVFGNGYWNMPNHIPESSHITVQQLIGIIVYWFMTCWTLSVPIPKLRRAYEIQMLVTPPVIIGTFFAMLQRRWFGLLIGRPDCRTVRLLHGDRTRTCTSGIIRRRAQAWCGAVVGTGKTGFRVLLRHTSSPTLTVTVICGQLGIGQNNNPHGQSAGHCTLCAK
jgi:NCS1 family nucleobase:cation symporter-1